MTKFYLFGYAWGIECHLSYPLMHEVRVKRRPMTGGRAVVFNETKVYKTRTLALRDAAKHKPLNGNKIFLIGMCYETRNPENAKGLPEWREEYGQREYINSVPLLREIQSNPI